jgi:hypothetical protein
MLRRYPGRACVGRPRRLAVLPGCAEELNGPADPREGYYPRPVLADHYRRLARRALHTARYWREESADHGESARWRARAAGYRRALAMVRASGHRITTAHDQAIRTLAGLDR